MKVPKKFKESCKIKKYLEEDIQYPDKLASDNQYHKQVRDINSSTPARFNADGRRLYEASGCAGKIAVFAVRLDTYPTPNQSQVFYLGTNDPKVLWKMRREILSNFKIYLLLVNTFIGIVMMPQKNIVKILFSN